MPTYIYKCENTQCGVKTERLVRLIERDTQSCLFCGKNVVREEINTFSVNTPLDTSKKDAYTSSEIDKVVGADANQKWTAFNDKLAKKIEGQTLIDIGVKPGEKFNSEAVLGDKSRRDMATKASEALKTSRETVKASGKNPDAWDKSGFKKINI